MTMMINDTKQLCEGEENVCRREIQAWCYHCSKNLCRTHLFQHVQLIEDKTREELNLLADQFNDLSSRFDHLNISTDVVERPFSQLEKWRGAAHEKIDQLVETKRKQLNDLIENYRKVFLSKNIEQMKKVESNQKLLVQLIDDVDASRQQINDLQLSIDQIHFYLNSLEKHQINLIAPLPDFSITFEHRFDDFELVLNNELRQFQITYVRLNGNIRSYLVLVKKDGTIKDLKTNFIQTFPLDSFDHQPKSDFILCVEVYNHRVHMQYEENHSLNVIHDRDRIIFYEISFSLKEENHSRILMPCSFRDASKKHPFGLPIYLDVPRRNCQGQHLFNAVQNTLGHFFQFDPRVDQHLYEANLVSLTDGTSKTIELNQILTETIDFAKTNAQIRIDINSQIAEIYQKSNFK